MQYNLYGKKFRRTRQFTRATGCRWIGKSHPRPIVGAAGAYVGVLALLLLGEGGGECPMRRCIAG